MLPLAFSDTKFQVGIQSFFPAHSGGMYECGPRNRQITDREALKASQLAIRFGRWPIIDTHSEFSKSSGMSEADAGSAAGVIQARGNLPTNRYISSVDTCVKRLIRPRVLRQANQRRPARHARPRRKFVRLRENCALRLCIFRTKRDILPV